MSDYRLKNVLDKKAKDLGFNIIKFAPAQLMDLWKAEIEQRKILDKATINYWSEKNLTSSYDTIMEDGRTFIVASYPYKPIKAGIGPQNAYINAHYMAYPKGRAAMQEIGDILISNNYKALVDPPLPIKHIAYKSGIGLFGKNGLIHNEKEGSLMTLHLLLTNADFPYSKSYDKKITDCGSCRKCIDACPNDAISDKGRIIVSKCLRYYMLSSDIIPVDIREKMGNRILGCEDCQITCPKNADKYKNIDQGDSYKEIFNIMDILKNHHGLKKYMKQLGQVIGKNYARPRRIISMAIIAAGNSGDSIFVEPLSQTLCHQDPPIRAHSAWALGRIAGKDAIVILKEALRKESDRLVVNEINNVINKT
ncbi:MAG TPA: 4Fe-4S double cluster binding domain-containing protein, partial [Bacillota bacterium]|nr:4Fe-4S double cluster binding domain-containing protein [Bacillota bacterium]